MFRRFKLQYLLHSFRVYCVNFANEFTSNGSTNTVLWFHVRYEFDTELYWMKIIVINQSLIIEMCSLEWVGVAIVIWPPDGSLNLQTAENFAILPFSH